MAITLLSGKLIRSGSIPTNALSGSVAANLPGNIVSSSQQVKIFLPSDTVSSSAQYPGWVTASSQIQLNAIAGTTFSNASFQFPQNLNINGTSTLQQVLERAIISGSGIAGTVNYNLLSGSIIYYTANSTGNWTVNFRGDAATTLNTLMGIGQCVTATLLATNGATLYSASAHQVDGSPITPKWQNSSQPSASANAIDTYSYVLIKTANNTFTLLASKVEFK